MCNRNSDKRHYLMPRLLFTPEMTKSISFVGMKPNKKSREMYACFGEICNRKG